MAIHSLVCYNTQVGVPFSACADNSFPSPASLPPLASSPALQHLVLSCPPSLAASFSANLLARFRCSFSDFTAPTSAVSNHVRPPVHHLSNRRFIIFHDTRPLCHHFERPSLEDDHHLFRCRGVVCALCGIGKSHEGKLTCSLGNHQEAEQILTIPSASQYLRQQKRAAACALIIK